MLPLHDEKARNRERSLAERRTMPEVCEALPVKLTVGNTHKCNLTCPMCFKQFEEGDNMSYPSLGMERFRRIAEACFTEADEVVLTVSGEPLISETIEEELAEGGRYGVKFCLTSNGTPLGVKRLRKLVLEHVGVLTLSLDGAKAETFETIRRGARFEKVMANVRALVEEKRAGGHETRIVGHMTLMRLNIEELPAWVGLMHELGLDACSAEPVEVLPMFAAMALESCPELANAKFDEAREVAERLGMPLTLPAYLPVGGAAAPAAPTGGGENRPTFEGQAIEAPPAAETGVGPSAARETLAIDRKQVAHPTWTEGDEHAPPEHEPIECPYAWSRSWINFDGSVKPCCHPGFVQEMGNIDREDFRAIWNGERYRRLRRTLRTGHAPQVCRDCYLVGLYSTDHAHVPEAAYRARLVAEDLPEPIEVEAGTRLPIRVFNDSPETWPAAARCGARYLALSSRWFLPGGEPYPFADPTVNGSQPRATIPRDVPPGGSILLQLPIAPPPGAGECLLELDLVHEGVTWFSQKGVSTLRLPVRVRGAEVPR